MSGESVASILRNVAMGYILTLGKDNQTALVISDMANCVDMMNKKIEFLESIGEESLDTVERLKHSEINLEMQTSLTNWLWDNCTISYHGGIGAPIAHSPEDFNGRDARKRIERISFIGRYESFREFNANCPPVGATETTP